MLNSSQIEKIKILKQNNLFNSKSKLYRCCIKHEEDNLSLLYKLIEKTAKVLMY